MKAKKEGTNGRNLRRDDVADTQHKALNALEIEEVNYVSRSSDSP